jgi:Kef-type K+ transport system membrane component KefB
MEASSLFVAMVLVIAAVVASMVSVELGLSVAIVELLLGLLLGNTMHLASPEWLVFLASLGSVVLTFNAGAEIDPAQLRRTWRASLLIGGASFAAPCVVVLLLCRLVLDWSWRAAEIGGIALSTTSVAVIWAVAVETGLVRTKLGQLLISSTFLTDLGTVLALSVLFVQPTWWLLPFLGVSVVLIVLMRGLEGWFFGRYGERVIEPELKGAFAALLVLMWLAAKANAQAVLPAFLLGFALAPIFARHRELQSRFRVVSFALLTPFFFLHAGMNVSLPLVLANVGLLVLLLAAKLASKSAAVYPLARRYAPSHAWPVALLMSTGLTFGTIASQAGLNMGVITRAQFSVLVCAVALSAVVPTAIAQHILARNPVLETEAEAGTAGRAPATLADLGGDLGPYGAGPGDDDEVPAHRRVHPPARSSEAPHPADAQESRALDDEGRP